MSLGSSSGFRRFGAACVAAAFLLSSAGIAAYAQEAASFLGTVFDPSGKPAEGFTVVFRDVASGKEIRSSKTNAAGQYQTTVPVGTRYKLQSVVAPDGTLLPVQDVPPIAVRVPGNNRLDVRFIAKAPVPVAQATPTPPAPAPPAPTPAAPKPVETAKAPPPPKPSPPPPSKPTPVKPVAVAKKEEKKDKGAVPWWKKPGGIVGIVLGVGAVAALAGGGGGGNNNPASASLPGN